MKKLHFAGIGGIGMSGLAAMACCQGIEVTGSDRGADHPENQRIIGALKNQGIRIYPQDGSFIRDGKPDFIVYSTAIEEDNPDFLASGDIPRLHRSALLGMLTSASGQETIAVTGSCGKSTVTAYMAETLFNLGSDPSCLNGALSKRFKSDCFAGNDRQGQGRYLIFEADESDKSLLNYTADYALILNIGTDHYSKEELAEVFGKFLSNVRKGAVLSEEVFEAVKHLIPAGLAIGIFDASCAEKGDVLEDYSVENRVPAAVFSGGRRLVLPQVGRHMALNALAIFSMLRMLGFEEGDSLRALERFDGIFRRTDLAGKTAQGAWVYDDYAHNPEKIVSCLETMRQLGSGRVLAVFQPHGYGPLGFMQEALFGFMEKTLRPGDIFVMMEPYYAGGTTSFKPSAQTVIGNWKSRACHPEQYMTFENREHLSAYLLSQARNEDVIVVMGARDNSLNDYAHALTLE